MRSELILVEPFSFITYTAIEITQQVNEHGAAHITGILDKRTEDDILEKISIKETVTIKAVEEDKEPVIIFKGVICQISLNVEGGIKRMEIFAKTHTCLMDMKKQIRVFQNTQQTVSAVAAYVGNENNARVICPEGKEQKIGRLVVQYQETDWEFLKRLASMLNTFVVADSINGRISFSLGSPRLKCKELLDYSCQTVRNLTEYHRQKNNGRENCLEQDTLSLMVTSRELLELCNPVQISGNTYYVKKLECHLVGNELVNTYELARPGGLKTTVIKNHNIAGVSLEGKISQVERDMVKVQFQQDVDSPLIWFPYATSYSSPDGTGWYCMPETGDAVRVYFPDEDESHGFAVNMIHLTCGLREEPDIKYIRSPNEKEIRFEPGAIRLTNHQGTSVVLDDKKGIAIKSSRNVVVLADGDIEMHAGKEIEVVGDDGVLARQGDNKIEIKDGIQQIARTITQR